MQVEAVLRERVVGLGGRVERGHGLGVEGGHAAAREEIVELGLHLERRVGRRQRGLAQRHQLGIAGVGLGMPVARCLHFGEEGFHAGAVHAGRLLVAVGHAAVQPDDFGDGGAHGFVLRRVGRDHAVAVEAHGGQQLAPVGDVGEGERVVIGPALDLQQAARFLQQPRAGGVAVVKVAQRQHVAALQQHVGVAKPRADPFARRDHFGRAHAAVAVGVDQVEGACVEVDAARRARERHPELLVELRDAGDVLAGAKDHLVGAARADELPAVRRVRGKGVGARWMGSIAGAVAHGSTVRDHARRV